MAYTTPKFVKDAHGVHGYRYSYTKAIYNGNLTPLTITCKEHGPFQQTPKAHLLGRGCYPCGQAKQALASLEKFANTVEQFVQRAVAKHGDKYDYSKVIYTSRECYVTIVCPTHGPFEQCAKNHLRGRGCQKCGSRIGQRKERPLTLDEIEFERSRKMRNDAYERHVNEQIKRDQDKERRLTPEQRAERREKMLAYLKGTLVGKDES